VEAIVIGADEGWCATKTLVGSEPPFPFWLVSPDLPSYVRGRFKFQALEQAFARVFTPSRRHFRPRPEDGFWDLELEYRWDRARLEAAPAPWMPVNPTGRYPGLDGLREVLAASPWVTPSTAVFLVRPPVWSKALPAPGTPEAASEEACKAALNRYAAERTDTTVIDWRADRDETRTPAYFFDPSHYREPVARKIETEIAARLRERRARQTDGS
jgi:hypothetical protein